MTPGQKNLLAMWIAFTSLFVLLAALGPALEAAQAAESDWGGVIIMFGLVMMFYGGFLLAIWLSWDSIKEMPPSKVSLWLLARLRQKLGRREERSS